MISIVVCSINEFEFERFSNSVRTSIGTDFEIIKICNSIENLSIAEAYNKGASLAKFDVLAFVHEDVVFQSNGWGNILLSFFSSLHNPGILGISGNSYHPISPSDWWVPCKNSRHFNYLSNTKNGNVGEGVLRSSNDFVAIRAFCLDGVFLACIKDKFEKFYFDEGLDGFHGYDTSLCLRFSLYYNNYYVPGICIEHFSVGNYNIQYLLNTIQANQSVLYSLPFSSSGRFKFRMEILSYIEFVKKISIYKLPFFRKINFIIKYFVLIIMSYFKLLFR
jgi:glycosyltransferase involved in cell wall biosynthesis